MMINGSKDTNQNATQGNSNSAGASSGVSNDNTQDGAINVGGDE